MTQREWAMFAIKTVKRLLNKDKSTTVKERKKYLRMFIVGYEAGVRATEHYYLMNK